jgi:hypothetical protein
VSLLAAGAAEGEGPCVIKICKAILSGSAPGQIREHTEGLASAPLRELAAQLASDPGLTVSVITYDDGRQELEILHTGPPHHTEDTIDRRRFTRQPQQTPARTLSVIGPGGLQDAVALVRAILLDATAP